MRTYLKNLPLKNDKHCTQGNSIPSSKGSSACHRPILRMIGIYSANVLAYRSDLGKISSCRDIKIIDRDDHGKISAFDYR